MFDEVKELMHKEEIQETPGVLAMVEDTMRKEGMERVVVEEGV